MQQLSSVYHSRRDQSGFSDDITDNCHGGTHRTSGNGDERRGKRERERERERVKFEEILHGPRVTSSPVPLSHSESVWHGCR